MEATSFNGASPAMPESAGLVSEINVDQAKFMQLSCRPTGDEKLMEVKFSCDDGTQKKVKQNYFRGLVYRFDSRPLVEIKEAGGFHPRIPRDKSDRLLAIEVIDTSIFKYRLFHETAVISRDCPGVISTSKLIRLMNCPVSSEFKKEYHYMIDTKMNDIWGLDPDYFRKRERPSCEVCFENPLPFNSIVGYFKDQNYETFYLNNEYQGGFSWRAEEILNHYQTQPPQNHKTLCTVL